MFLPSSGDAAHERCQTYAIWDDGRRAAIWWPSPRLSATCRALRDGSLAGKGNGRGGSTMSIDSSEPSLLEMGKGNCQGTIAIMKLIAV
jgi:hypothetical protein